jgi:hypothetical protein
MFEKSGDGLHPSMLKYLKLTATLRNNGLSGFRVAGHGLERSIPERNKTVQSISLLGTVG